MMKRIATFLVVLSAMIISVQPAWAAPKQDLWREAKLAKGQGLTQLLVANSCGIDRLFEVMDRNNISVKKLRSLDPKKPIFIPTAEVCMKPAEPKDARVSKEIILVDALGKAAREAANKTLLAANTRLQELEARLTQVLAEKNQAVEELKAERERIPAAPVSAQAEAPPARGFSGLTLAFTLAFGLIVGGGGVKLFSANSAEHGFVRYKEEVEVEMPDGTRHTFPYAGASPPPGSDLVAPQYKCEYCSKRDLRERDGTPDPHVEFKDHLRATHFSMRVRIIRRA
jgi:hypothetical protein